MDPQFSLDVSFISNSASATAGVVREKISEMLCELLYFFLTFIRNSVLGVLNILFSVLIVAVLSRTKHSIAAMLLALFYVHLWNLKHKYELLEVSECSKALA